MSSVGKYINGKYEEFASTGNKNIGKINPNKAIVSDSSGNIVSSSVTDAELESLSGVESNIQAQIDALASKPDPTPTEYSGAVTTILNDDLPTDKVLVSDGNGKVASSEISKTQLGYLEGLAGNIQAQINNIIENMPSGGGYVLGDVKNLSASSGSGGISLTWEDPDNVVFNGENVAEFGGTKVMRKEGSYSENPEDGTLVVDESAKDTYKDTPLLDSNTTDGITYFYTLFPRTTEGAVTLSDNNKVMQEKTSYSSVLEENTWEQIIEAINLGIHKDLWKIGDSKKIDLTGVQYWDGIYDAIIVDWEHYTRSNDSDKMNNVVFMFKQLPNTAGSFASANNKDYNYDYSNWCKSLCPPLETAVPDAIKNNIIGVTIQCLGRSNSNITYANQRFFPNTLAEVIGGMSGNDGGSLLEYFKTHNAITSRIGDDNPFPYWCRSRTVNYAYYVDTNGAQGTMSTTSYGNAWRCIFCL